MPAGIVRRIVLERQSGRSFRAIAADLTTSGVRSPEGCATWQDVVRPPHLPTDVGLRCQPHPTRAELVAAFDAADADRDLPEMERLDAAINAYDAAVKD